MSRLTRDGTAEPVSRDQILRHARGQGKYYFPCSADHEQNWQPYPVDLYSAICDDHTYIHTYGVHWATDVFAYFYPSRGRLEKRCALLRGERLKLFVGDFAVFFFDPP